MWISHHLNAKRKLTKICVVLLLFTAMRQRTIRLGAHGRIHWHIKPSESQTAIEQCTNVHIEQHAMPITDSQSVISSTPIGDLPKVQTRRLLAHRAGHMVCWRITKLRTAWWGSSWCGHEGVREKIKVLQDRGDIVEVEENEKHKNNITDRRQRPRLLVMIQPESSKNWWQLMQTVVLRFNATQPTEDVRNISTSHSRTAYSIPKLSIKHQTVTLKIFCWFLMRLLDQSWIRIMRHEQDGQVLRKMLINSWKLWDLSSDYARTTKIVINLL